MGSEGFGVLGTYSAYCFTLRPPANTPHMWRFGIVSGGRELTEQMVVRN